VINITTAIYRYSIGTFVRDLRDLRDLRDSGEYLVCATRLLRDAFYITDVAIGCEGIIIRMRYSQRT